MIIEIKRFDHVQLSIPKGSEDVARRFYSGILGFVEIEKPDALKSNGGLWFQVAEIEVHLGIEDNHGKVKRHPAFEVTNLDQIKSYLQAQEIEIKEEIPIPAINRFSFFDPFGNRIEFLERRCPDES